MRFCVFIFGLTNIATVKQETGMLNITLYSVAVLANFHISHSVYSPQKKTQQQYMCSANVYYIYIYSWENMYCESK